MGEREKGSKAGRLCAESRSKIRVVAEAVRKAPGPEDALQIIRGKLPSGGDMQERLEEIITEAIARHFPSPKI